MVHHRNGSARLYFKDFIERGKKANDRTESQSLIITNH